jgi:hypothetical protein
MAETAAPLHQTAERAASERLGPRPSEAAGEPARALQLLSLVESRRRASDDDATAGSADAFDRARAGSIEWLPRDWVRPSDVVALQRTAGNRAVVSLLDRPRRASTLQRSEAVAAAEPSLGPVAGDAAGEYAPEA